MIKTWVKLTAKMLHAYFPQVCEAVYAFSSVAVLLKDHSTAIVGYK
jgi:hypothetical protein